MKCARLWQRERIWIVMNSSNAVIGFLNSGVGEVEIHSNVETGWNSHIDVGWLADIEPLTFFR